MIEINDNLLSAFLDGNVNAEEAKEVLAATQQDEQLQELMRISAKIDADLYVPDMLPMQALAADEKRNRCVMQCELYILRKHGLVFDEADWEKQARRHGWLKEEGTALFNIGRMLEQECFSTTRTYHNTTDNIRTALQSGKDVIVVVDSKELMTDSYRLQAEYIHDAIYGVTPNHAVVVTSVDNSDVFFYDPASDNERTLPIAQFEQTWDDSSCYMVCISERNLADYIPHPIDLSDVTLPDSIEELREAIAENAHEVWAQGRKAQGWTYGPERNDQLKQTPDMIPYSDLTDSEKFFDREMAMNTLKLIKKIGYDIVKLEDKTHN